jgi:hypothetical protein
MAQATSAGLRGLNLSFAAIAMASNQIASRRSDQAEGLLHISPGQRPGIISGENIAG